MQEKAPSLAEGVIAAAQSVIDHINQDEVARFVAMKNPDESSGAKARKQKMEAQEAALVTAYSAIAEAIFDRAPKVIILLLQSDLLLTCRREMGFSRRLHGVPQNLARRPRYSQLAGI